MDFPLSEEEVEWDGDAFRRMKNLRTLIIRNGLFSKGPNHLPNTLRVLEWWRYPSKDLPNDFHPEKLAICKLPNSGFTSLELAALLLKKLQRFVNLTCLNFDDCRCLTEIPDVSCLPHLEKLSFQLCTNLLTIHNSIGFLEKLKILNAVGCINLKSFPPIKLTSLEQLDLWLCISLESFPEILGKMESITRLDLSGTSIQKLPLSFRNLTKLQELEMGYGDKLRISSYDAAIFIRNISMMPELAKLTASRWQVEGWLLPKEDEDAENVSLTMSSNIQHLHLKHCYLLDDFFPTLLLPLFANVKELDLSENDFTVIPECIKECCFLTSLTLNNCEHLREIRGIPSNLKYFSAKGCRSMTYSCRSMLLSQELHEAGNTHFYLPRANFPKWFECQTWGPSISFWFRNKFPLIAICLIMEGREEYYSFSSRVFYPVVTINGKRSYVFHGLGMGTCCTCLFGLQMTPEDNLDEVLLENEWNHAEVIYEDQNSVPTFIKSIIHALKQQSNMEDIRFTDPYRKRRLDDDLNYSSESPNEQLLKRQRLVDMEDIATEFVQQQQQQHMGFFSRMWNWALAFIISSCSSNQ